MPELLTNIKRILKLYQIKLKHFRGQNFLIDRSVLKKIISAAELREDDLVLEIGAGLGILTEELAKRAKKVIAVEIDEKLCQILKERLTEYKNVEIVQKNILELQVTSYKLQDFKVVANIPYYLTGRILRKFLEEESRPDLIVLLLQKEVAERICAKAGKMSLLSVAVQFYGKPKIISLVKSKSFYPAPKVDSSIVSISRIGANFPPASPAKRGEQISPIDEKNFFAFVHRGFTSPRKQLINNLKIDKEKLKSILKNLNLNPYCRAQDLSVEDWIKLYWIINSKIKNQNER